MRTPALLLLLLAACRDELVIDRMPECERRIHLLAMDEASSVGITPAQVVALASGHRELPVRWNDPDRGFIVGPETGTGTAVIDVSHGKGAARFVDMVPPRGLTDADCPDFVEVDMNVSLTTAGGGLAEKVVMPVGAANERLASGSTFIDIADFRGKQRFTEHGNHTHGFEIDLSFTPFGVSGAIDGEVADGTGDSAMVGFGQVALLGTSTASRCDRAFIDMPLDAEYRGRRPRELLDRWDALGSLQLGWEGAAPVPATIELTPAGGCLDVATGDVMTVPGDVEVRAGPMDVRAPAELSGTAAAMELSGRVWEIDRREFARKAGETGIDSSAFDGASWALTIDGSSAGITGSVQVSGITAPDCTTPPPATESEGESGGCEGATTVPVAVGAITLAAGG